MKHFAEFVASALTVAVVWLAISACAAMLRRLYDRKERQMAEEWVRDFRREEGRL